MDNKSVFRTISFTKEQNNALKEVYERKSKTRKNIYYICNEKLVGADHEATIDGIHFNDLGHFRAYEHIRQEITKIVRP